MIRKGALLAFVLILIPSISMATLYTLTDPSGVGAGTEYTLDVTSLGGTSYNAVLTAATADTTTDVYLDWFQIKFDGGTAAFITTVNADPEGDWLALQGSGGVNLAEFGNETFANPTSAGLYLTGAVEGASFATLATGPELDGLTKIWDFNFTLDAPFNPTPSLQVGYYYLGGNPNDPQIMTGRLSEEFRVPEASALILFGSGLAGLVVWRRKKRLE
jgi:hypothetical protein